MNNANFANKHHEMQKSYNCFGSEEIHHQGNVGKHEYDVASDDVNLKGFSLFGKRQGLFFFACIETIDF